MGLYQGSKNIVTGREQSNLVTTDEDQTISGKKTFYSDGTVNVYMQTGSGAYGGFDIPNYNTWLTNIYSYDSQKALCGSVEVWADKDGYNRSMLGVSKNGLFSSIYVKMNADADIMTYCPPSDNLESIVTTTGISKSVNGYVKMGNGIIEQWGNMDLNASVAGGATSSFSVTYSTPYTSYKTICLTPIGSEANGFTVTVFSFSNTGFTYVIRNITTTTHTIYAIRWFTIGY